MRLAADLGTLEEDGGTFGTEIVGAGQWYFVPLMMRVYVEEEDVSPVSGNLWMWHAKVCECIQNLYEKVRG